MDRLQGLARLIGTRHRIVRSRCNAFGDAYPHLVVLAVPGMLSRFETQSEFLPKIGWIPVRKENVMVSEEHFNALTETWYQLASVGT